MSPTNANMEQIPDHKTGQSKLPMTESHSEWLKSIIRDVPDFPKPGIVFKDLTTLLKDAEALSFVLEALSKRCESHRPHYVAAIEARGFIYGSGVAQRLGAGFVPIRKPGKLPYKVERETYELEYGTDTVEVHIDAVEKGRRVVLIDDLLATGGTALAAYRLLSKLGAEVVGVGFVVELGFLGGRSKLPDSADVFSLVTYE